MQSFFHMKPDVCRSDFERKNVSLYFIQNPTYVGLFFNPLRPTVDSHQPTATPTPKNTQLTTTKNIKHDNMVPCHPPPSSGFNFNAIVLDCCNMAIYFLTA